MRHIMSFRLSKWKNWSFQGWQGLARSYRCKGKLGSKPTSNWFWGHNLTMKLYGVMAPVETNWSFWGMDWAPERSSWSPTESTTFFLADVCSHSLTSLIYEVGIRSVRKVFKHWRSFYTSHFQISEHFTDTFRLGRHFCCRNEDNAIYWTEGSFKKENCYSFISFIYNPVH